MILVHLGNVDKAGHIPLFAVLPGLLKAYGDAVLGRAHQNGGIRGTEGFHGGTGEIETAGGVQQIDLAVMILQGHHGGGDGDIAADLLGVVVADGISVGVPADPVDGTGHVK